MLSKLQTNLLRLKRRLQVKDLLVYSDASNYMRYEVIAVDRNIFTAVELETGEVEDRNIFNLQHGWDFDPSYIKELELLVKN